MKISSVSVLSLVILVFLSCEGGALKHQPDNSTRTLNDDVLVKLIKTFSEDAGEEGQKALDQLRSLPGIELSSDLSRLRRSLPSTDPLQPQIAFVFCYFDQDYKANADVVISALSKDPKYQNFYADQAASLLARLVKRGDKSLLLPLFGAVRWADGALAEELGASFADELKNNAHVFVEMLTDQPREVRLKVYGLIDSTDSLTSKETKLIEATLRKINPQSKSYRVAQEILTSVVLK